MRLMGNTVFSQIGNSKIDTDDFWAFKSLYIESEKFHVATKIFAQWGKNKAA